MVSHGRAGRGSRRRAGSRRRRRRPPAAGVSWSSVTSSSWRGRGVDDQRDLERNAGEGLGRVAEQAVVAGAEALDGDRAGDARASGCRRSGRARAPPGTRCSRWLRTAGRGRRQPPLPTGHRQQVCPRWRLPRVVHRCVHRCAEALARAFVSAAIRRADGGGSAEHRISRRTGVADHISAVDNATSDTHGGRRSAVCAGAGCARAGLSMRRVRARRLCRCSRPARRAACALLISGGDGAPRPGAPSGCGPGVRGGHA